MGGRTFPASIVVSATTPTGATPGVTSTIQTSTAASGGSETSSSYVTDPATSGSSGLSERAGAAGEQARKRAPISRVRTGNRKRTSRPLAYLLVSSESGSLPIF